MAGEPEAPDGGARAWRRASAPTAPPGERSDDERLADKQLKGSFPPLVTPFKDDGSVDYDTYAKLVEFQVKGGSHGIVVTGTTGEPSILTTDERIELVKVAVSAAKKRIQVVAATGAQNHADTVKMTEAAEKAGADALLIVTPYFIRPPARGLEAYYLDLCKRTDLPVMIYHIPGRAAVTMTRRLDRAHRRGRGQSRRRQARGDRSRARQRADHEARPRVPHPCRARGAVVPDGVPRRARADERGRQSAARQDRRAL